MKLDLSFWRGRINAIDLNLLRLFAYRFDVVKKILEIKAESGIPFRDLSREKKHLEEIELWGKDHGLPKGLAARLFALIMDLFTHFQTTSHYTGKDTLVTGFCPRCKWRTSAVRTLNNPIPSCIACKTPLDL